MFWWFFPKQKLYKLCGEVHSRYGRLYLTLDRYYELPVPRKDGTEMTLCVINYAPDYGIRDVFGRGTLCRINKRGRAMLENDARPSIPSRRLQYCELRKLVRLMEDTPAPKVAQAT